MTTIGILSDTHGCWDDRYAYHLAQCDEIWHAGDIGDVDTLRRIQGIGPKVRAVRGNIDHGEVLRECPEVLTFMIEECPVVMTHIGGYPGRYAPGVRDLLLKTGARLMVAGHSHILKVMPDATLGLLHVNPGAAGRQGWHRKRTLLRLTIDGSTVKSVEVIELAPK